ncbi:hypothetical protein RO3G_11172 [Rhizopus delemar RA 99-880]|uniref:FAD-binding PCMH-type domain-containing protein n=1 Tax=Rhizopus delemar (strain RA 99-880 / ATCC MYA-4621 / FGSC 9543 / NRRL 43880) TaxID=246409 RepID=I1CDD1_RHIO9|nr:hypothetical protein RO3G_11172 [Rhizopus delemar RA 99-880]|eukprot:EIE86461.1 hypothetical protein RO3G_11172 [Rhizopus delemar RA 99-880]
MLQRRLFHSSKATLYKTLTPLTHVKHAGLKRNSNFAKITDKDIDYFKSVLSPNNIIYEPDPESLEIKQHNVDWFNLYRGSSSLCLFPTTTEQVSKVLRYCNQHSLAVVPQGGNTGVSGGAVPIFDEIILNSSKMNKIRHFDEISGVAVVDCGVILENLSQFLEPKGYTVPLDLGAKGSCQIGGNVSTNAGGLRLIKYGNLHGAEGTLGYVTGVSLLTPRLPKAVNVAMIALNSFETVQKAFVMAKEDLSEILSAFEFWDHESVDVVKSQMMDQSNYPIEGKHAFYALIETQGSNREHDQEKLDSYITRLFQADVAKDGVLAQDSKQAETFWSWREEIPGSIAKSGTAMTYDFGLDAPLLYKMVEDTKDHFDKKGLLGKDKLYSNLIGFGHLGDGNLHLMANLNEFDNGGQSLMDDFVFDWAIKHNGSISAEHGIGISKVHYMKKAKTDAQLRIMKTLKDALDPKGIMNPYKIIPEQS